MNLYSYLVMHSTISFIFTQSTSTEHVNKKNNPPEKMLCFSCGKYGFEPNFQTIYMSIHAIYPANVIEITDLVQQNRYSSLNFKVHFFK